jgi:hypothetical protein
MLGNLKVNKMEDKHILLLCSCYSSEHQMIIHLDKGGDMFPPEAFVHVHLVRRSFLYRVKYAIKYIFGFTSRYGAWDEFILDKSHVKSLLQLAKHLDDETVY